MNRTLCDARTAGPELTVTRTGPPMVPGGMVTNVSCPAFAVQGTTALPFTVTQPELADAPELSMWMLSAPTPGDVLSYHVR